MCKRTYKHFQKLKPNLLLSEKDRYKEQVFSFLFPKIRQITSRPTKCVCVDEETIDGSLVDWNRKTFGEDYGEVLMKSKCNREFSKYQGQDWILMNIYYPLDKINILSEIYATSCDLLFKLRSPSSKIRNIDDCPLITIKGKTYYDFSLQEGMPQFHCPYHTMCINMEFLEEEPVEYYIRYITSPIYGVEALQEIGPMYLMTDESIIVSSGGAMGHLYLDTADAGLLYHIVREFVSHEPKGKKIIPGTTWERYKGVDGYCYIESNEFLTITLGTLATVCGDELFKSNKLYRQHYPERNYPKEKIESTLVCKVLSFPDFLYVKVEPTS